jgi:hypothetical protein
MWKPAGFHNPLQSMIPQSECRAKTTNKCDQ